MLGCSDGTVQAFDLDTPRVEGKQTMPLYCYGCEPFEGASVNCMSVARGGSSLVVGGDSGQAL